MGMLIWAIAFAVIAVVAGAVGVTEFSGMAVAIAKLVFFICLVVVPVLLTFATIVGKR
jgi:uncharacterized membrane protein YtjA (UPF0391 family)